jgi:hypothetical protein
MRINEVICEEEFDFQKEINALRRQYGSDSNITSAEAQFIINTLTTNKEKIKNSGDFQSIRSRAEDAWRKKSQPGEKPAQVAQKPPEQRQPNQYTGPRKAKLSKVGNIPVPGAVAKGIEQGQGAFGHLNPFDK